MGDSDGGDYYQNAHWWLQAPSANDRDRRDGRSNYVCVHKWSRAASKWRAVPADNGRTVEFQLAGDHDNTYGGNCYQNAGWWLQAPSANDSDKRDEMSNYVCVH